MASFWAGAGPQTAAIDAARPNTTTTYNIYIYIYIYI